MANFKEKLKALRKNKKMSQVALGEKIGVTKATIYNWEKGGRYPSRANMKLLADALSVKVESLQIDGVLNASLPALTLTASGTTESNVVPVEAHIVAKTSMTADATRLRPIPLIAEIPAGDPRETFDSYPVGCGEEMVYTDSTDPHAFALRVIGESML